MLLRFMFRKLSFLGNQYALYRRTTGPYDNPDRGPAMGKGLIKNLAYLKDNLSDSCDLKVHPLEFGPKDQWSGAMVFIEGMVDNGKITDGILRPLKDWRPEGKMPAPGDGLINELAKKVICAGSVKPVASLGDVMLECLSGNTAVLVEGCATGLIIGTKGWEKRSVSEPQSETVIRGPREGFTENICNNTALVRRKIRSGRLHVENLIVGRKSQTDVRLMYLEDVASHKVVAEVKKRLDRLDVDAILESGYIEEYIEDAPFSPFSTVGYSEKPDVIAAQILEGRVAILVDGTPFVLTAPMLFIESFQTTEDYYTRPLYASLVRMLRFVGYLITIFAPALYIALTSFHQEFIPTTLLFSIANAREGTPFPVLLETLGMVFAFEILREAGIRLPRPVGQAISIVGALVMGDAAVSAGLVGAPVVITVAITAVASFLVPAQNDAASVLRVVMMILASFTGWYGISMGALAVLMHLGSLNSFGVPYFNGLAWTRDQEDTIVRMPLWFMIRRPQGIPENNEVRSRFFIPDFRPHEARDEDDEDEQWEGHKEKGAGA